MNSLRHLVLGCAAVASFSLAACGSSSGGGPIPKASKASASASAIALSSASAVADTGAGGSVSGTNGSTVKGEGSGSGSGGGPTLSINVTTPANCASGTNLHMVSGVSPVIAWHSTGTTNVTLNIDGGLYGTFPSDGSDELPFTCSGTTDGQPVSHTYVFTTIPGGVTRSVTLNSTYHIITNVSGPTTPPATPSAPPSS